MSTFVGEKEYSAWCEQSTAAQQFVNIHVKDKNYNYAMVKFRQPCHARA
jgi:hypothetical protein